MYTRNKINKSYGLEIPVNQISMCTLLYFNWFEWISEIIIFRDLN